MATIKLQPSGKVVIKDGKVSCGCCVNCPEICRVTIPQSIRNLVENATQTSWTLNGLAPREFFRLSPTEWTAIMGLTEGDDYYWDIGYLDGCLVFFLSGTPGNENTLAETGTAEFGCGEGQEVAYKKFNINGINEFDYFDYTQADPFPTPTFIFT